MKVCVWFSILGTYNPPKSQVLLCGEMLIGLGPMQLNAELEEVTIGTLREDWGMQNEFAALPGELRAWVYTDDTKRGDGENSLTAVLVDLEELRKMA